MDKNTINSVKPLMDSKKYQQAVPILFKIAYGNSNQITPKQKTIAQQWLGVALFRLGYNQAAAFPLIASIGQADQSVSEKSILTLIQITDQLNDKSLLSYAVSKLDMNTKLSKEVFYTKSAEVFLNQDQVQLADENFLKALQVNPKNENALYQLGLSYLKKNDPKKAYSYFEQLESLYSGKSILDEKKGLATLAIARTLYQAKQWKSAIEAYRDIPKNYEFYRQSQFEMAWAHFRSLNFRAALGTIETLQTPFYETYYDPESLILRMIILMFVCQSEDLNSAVQKYEAAYLPMQKQIENWQQKNSTNSDIIEMIRQTNLNLKLIQNGYQQKFKTGLPFYFVRTILSDKKINSQHKLISKIKAERSKFKKSNLYQVKALRVFFEKIYTSRIQTAQQKIVTDFKRAVNGQLNDLKQYNSQFELIKYEALGIKKTQLKLASQMTVSEKNSLESNLQKSSYYSENGFRYWPFDGEFWIDEIGNYQYVGINRCISE